MNRRARWVVGLVAVAALGAGRADAGQWWNPLSWFRQAPVTVVVTGNYTKPRLLAELAQARTRVPLLLVTPPIQGEVVYVMPARGPASAGPKEEFAAALAALKPAQVVFLGDAEHMPSAYVGAAEGAGFPVVVLAESDWNQNAARLGTLLKSAWIPQRYAELLPILDARTDAAPALPAVPALPDTTPAMEPAAAAAAAPALNLVPPEIKP